MLGGWDGKNEGYYYRAGYCPAVIEGNFVKSKTMLFPGHHSTPEYGSLGRLPLPHEERERMRDEARKLNARRLWDTGDFSLVKRFHESGVPQVIHSLEQFYKETD